MIRCNEPFEMERKGNIEELICKNTRKINAFLETLILITRTNGSGFTKGGGGQKIAGLSFASCKLSVGEFGVFLFAIRQAFQLANP